MDVSGYWPRCIFLQWMRGDFVGTDKTRKQRIAFFPRDLCAMFRLAADRLDCSPCSLARAPAELHDIDAALRREIVSTFRKLRGA